MKKLLENIRGKSIPLLLAAAMLIVVVVGVQYYMSIANDDENARKLVNRELHMVEQRILNLLTEAETSLDDMHDATRDELANPERMLGITREVVKQNPFIKAVAIGFVPYYYKDRGRLYEPYSMVQGDSIVTGVADDNYEGYDYTTRAWYIDGQSRDIRRGKWGQPYVDDTQNNSYVMSLSRPLYYHGKLVAVLCLDVELKRLRQMLKKAEPYPGSVCRLLDKDGNVLAASSEDNPSDADFFTDQKKIANYDMVLVLSCPENMIYGNTAMMNIITFGLLFIGMLLLGFIVQRTIVYHIRLGNARKEQKQTEHEMQIAHGIQMHMLRQDFPHGLWATLKPMKEVGGDLYDFYQNGQDIYFIIGDVSGKGIPAAMMMAATVNLFRMAVRHFSTPVEITCEINRILSENNSSMMFVTAFVGKIDKSHGLLTYCNAGHNPPILNDILMKTDPDIPIGYDAGYTYRQYGELFPEGSRLVLYTDGVTEARNNEKKFMGIEHLLSITREYSSLGAESVVTHIMDATQQFFGDSEQRDDITLVCIENDTPSQPVSLVIRNDVEEFRRVKGLLREYCGCMKLSRRQSERIVLAAEEALSNVIHYAYPKGVAGKIDVTFNTTTDDDGDYFTITISDSGEEFNPLAQPPIDPEQTVSSGQIGGLGIYLYQQLMDDVSYERTPDGQNVLILKKKL